MNKLASVVSGLLYLIFLPRSVSPVRVNPKRPITRRVQKISQTPQKQGQLTQDQVRRLQKISQTPQKQGQLTQDQVKFAQDLVKSMLEDSIAELEPSTHGRGRGHSSRSVAARWSHLPGSDSTSQSCSSCLPPKSDQASVSSSSVEEDWASVGSAIAAQMTNNLLTSIGASRVEARKAANQQRIRVEKRMRSNRMRIRRIRDRTTPSRVQIVSATTHIRPWTNNVTANQHLWTSMHSGLEYIFIGGEPAAGLLDEQVAPQWLKIRVLQSFLQSALEQHRNASLTSAEYILWIDDDIVITNPKNFVEDMVDRMGRNHHMLIAQDAGDPDSGVNSGMMLFRTTPQALKLLTQIWRMSSHMINWKTKVTLGTCKNQECLHEQEGINLLRSRNINFKSSVKVVPPVDEHLNMNTFYRETHHDRKRRLWIRYDTDPEEYKWDLQKDMNTCHVTGMVEDLRASFIDDCLIAAEKAFKMPQVVPPGANSRRPTSISF